MVVLFLEVVVQLSPIVCSVFLFFNGLCEITPLDFFHILGHFPETYPLCPTQRKNFLFKEKFSYLPKQIRNRYSFTCYLIHLLLPLLLSVGMSKECISLNRSHSCVNSKSNFLSHSFFQPCLASRPKLDKAPNVFQLQEEEACGRALFRLSHLF